MAGLVKEIAEKAKVAVRNVRRDANKGIDQAEKDKTISEDQKFDAREEIQDLTSGHEKNIDDLATKKTDEVMEV
jgi:ribosome recycling factor